MVHHVEHLIGGSFIGGPCDTAAPKQVVMNLITGSVLGVAAEGDWPEADAALFAASRAFETWQQTSGSERAGLLRRVAALLAERRDEFSMLMAQEIGKPLDLARGEIDRGLVTLELSARAAETFGNWEPVDLGPDVRAPKFWVEARRRALGVVLAITPWNWPINLALHKLGPALAVGNTIVLKGSQRASLCTLELVRLFHDAGFPAGVVNGINVPGRIASQMATQDCVAKVSFTGSPSVGWNLKAATPKKQVTLELGGNAYAMVLPGGDLRAIAKDLAESATAYAGQICISLQNIRVEASIFDEFKQHLLEAIAAIAFGDPRESGVHCGPMISKEEADRLRDWCDEARANGAEIHSFGRDEGHWLPPAVLIKPHPHLRIVREEAFAPVVTLSPFDHLDEAVAEVEASRYGIHTSVYTTDPALQKSLIERLRTPGIVVNAPPTVRFDAMPYGGRDDSGFGREGVHYAIQDMSSWQTRVERIG